jgi:hypothetical protein
MIQRGHLRLCIGVTTPTRPEFSDSFLCWFLTQQNVEGKYSGVGVGFLVCLSVRNLHDETGLQKLLRAYGWLREMKHETSRQQRKKKFAGSLL